MTPPPACTRPLSRHLSDLCRENAAIDPDRLAVISGDVELTFGELDRVVDGAASGLATYGICRGSTVGLLCTNRWEWLATAFGAMRLGARVAAFNTFARAWDLDYMLEHSRSEVLVAVGAFRTRDYLETVTELVPEVADPAWTSSRYPSLREIVIIGDGERPPGCRGFTDLLAAEPVVPVEHTSAADDAFVVYTSGSSARPKAVPLQHYATIENAHGIGRRMQLTAEDRVWVSVPLFWSYGAVNATPAALTHRASLLLQDAFEPAVALELIERHRATVAYTLPNMTQALVDHEGFTPERTSSLRTGLTIGSAEDVRRAAVDLGVDDICNIYGSTETYGNCCVTFADWPLERRMASQGPALPGVMLRVVDAETGDERSAGEVGELHVSGYTARRYLGGDEHENAAFGADGWYRTGDLGFVDDDGCFHFVTRATEMIKTGGINVAPGEVEEFLRLHDGVRHAAVVGVPDAGLGEAVVAFVVAEGGSDVTEEELRAWCRRRIAAFKVPSRFHLVDDLPKTDTGKLARQRLIELDAEARIG